MLAFCPRSRSSALVAGRCSVGAEFSTASMDRRPDLRLAGRIGGKLDFPPERAGKPGFAPALTDVILGGTAKDAFARDACAFSGSVADADSGAAVSS